MRQIPLTVFALALLMGSTGAAPAQDAVMVGPLRLSHLWAPPTSETAKAAPGYLTITNTGSAPDRLVGGSFGEAEEVQVHTMSGQGAAAKMVPAEGGGLVIAPGETVTLKPGGPHLMFVGLRSPLRQGATEQAIIKFERAGTKYVDFAIEGPAPKAGPAKRAREPRT